MSGASHGHGQDATVAVEAPDSELQAKLQAELGTEYILERELGRGGMAIVYLGRDAHLNRKIAVKVLPPELTYGGGTMIQRFKREAQTAAKLDHPNIIPVYRVAPGGTLVWYVMKYLEGESLDHLLEREGQLSVERTVDIVGQVAAALDYAHQNQVVHRDVKPANVVVDKRGRVTVTDFGIAKALDASTLTASGSIIGTPYYMSPEQCKGKKVGPAADQYSLAVMTYQMLGGHVPFTGDSAVEIVHKHVADPVPPLGVLRPNLPEKVLQVVDRGLAKTAEERFATVAEFARVLKAAAEGVDVTVSPPVKPGVVRTSRTALVSPVPGAMQAPTASPPARSRKALVFGGIGGGLAVAAVAAALVLKPWASPSSLQQQATQLPTRDTTPPAAAPPPVVAPPADTVTKAAPAAVTTARVILRGVPSGATVERDGRRWRGGARTVVVTPGRRHTIAVVAAGYERWSRDVTLQAGQEQAFDVTLSRQAQPVAAGGGKPAPVQPAAAPTVTPQAGRPSAAPAAEAVGYISVMTDPRSTVFVNGTRVKSTPLTRQQVPAGTVQLRFEVTDSTGVWSVARTVSVQPGQEFRILPMPLRLARPKP